MQLLSQSKYCNNSRKKPGLYSGIHLHTLWLRWSQAI